MNAPQAGSGETILVVDDDESAREGVARLLERLGYRVLTAGAPRSALRVADEFPLDLLVVDVILPSTSGLLLAEDLRRQQPRVRVLYMSGYTGPEVLRDQTLPESAVGFLQKPFTYEDLAQGVRAVLDGRPAEAG